MRCAAGQQRQKGFSLVTAIFVMVILATLGSYMVSISHTQRATSVFAIQQARAYKTAQGGIQWGIRRAFDAPAVNCSLLPAPPLVAPAFPLPAADLTGFTVSVSCNYTAHTEGVCAFNIFRITATSQYSIFGNPDFVSRRLEAVVTDRNC